jgi:hypothetical protein
VKQRDFLQLKIISGGQTGADRAALDWAIAHDIEHGGWCPRGRRAENGIIPLRYRLVETPSSDYAQRTLWNVRDSDATVLFSGAPVLNGGSLYTKEVAQQLHRPWLHLHGPEDEAARSFREFLALHDVAVLNVAGPRASNQPDIGRYVTVVLDTALALCY